MRISSNEHGKNITIVVVVVVAFGVARAISVRILIYMYICLGGIRQATIYTYI